MTITTRQLNKRELVAILNESLKDADAGETVAVLIKTEDAHTTSATISIIKPINGAF